MWFPVFLFMVGGQADPSAQAYRLKDTIAQHHRSASSAVCEADAAALAVTLQEAGFHGRFLCMSHGEPDRQLAAATHYDF